MRRRLFQRLQQRVEGLLRQHVHFVDDVDLVARRDRSVAHALDQLAHVVDAGARRRVHLDHVDVAILGDRRAVGADAAGIDSGTTVAVGANAVQRAGNDARGRGLADAAHAGEHEGVGDAARGDGVAQGAHHRLLADQGGEIDGTVFAGEDTVGKCGSCRCRDVLGPIIGTSAFGGFRHGGPTRWCAVAPSGPAVVAPGPPAFAAARAKGQVRDQHDPKRIRYGCFLPDLTGLATAPPTLAPRGGYIRSRTASRKG